ncbi:MAG: hypothetical protein EA350_06795 [Gemmatimonadales bacterium]|nr:MAG: hypothetical protein EA350_06795 [Gemmatimonadales bacterium]
MNEDTCMAGSRESVIMPGATGFTKAKIVRASPLAVVLLLAAAAIGCGEQEAPAAEGVASATLEPLPPAQEAFWANLQEHCGQAFRGGAAILPDNDPRRDEMYRGRTMVMHVRQCSENEIKVPLHTDDDRSRTWIFTRQDGGLDLRHDHRQPDGTEDSSTMYGAHTLDEGTPNRQAFPRVQPDGIRTGWIVEIVPNERFVYGNLLSDGENWNVRFDFDLTEPVETPPAPWGHEHTEAYPAGGP